MINERDSDTIDSRGFNSSDAEQQLLTGTEGNRACGGYGGYGNAGGSVIRLGSGGKPRSTDSKLNGFEYCMRVRRPAVEAEGLTFPRRWKDFAAVLNEEYILFLFLNVHYEREASRISSGRCPTSEPNNSEDASSQKPQNPKCGPFW